ncbi:bifunctional DNA primase/polymerase [Novosphingobium sp. KACC 22771]|uniref:bifunctional DNA primase/polymerase n=1 Tax=Novosphingobium sp. KACC 22771 TaxID=3025670 RepID=UPI002366D318|nr:bifunctional DNA primase/polymerase [Novosphingobium sp. KACC 22771]WDF73936.1 bifunctional DNA primase/polymerase [Novosphingobium sp. KACC 22771]
MTAPDLLAAALDYADKGLPVFPCHSENKRPLTPNSFYDASTDRATVADWWKRWPTAMIGLPTGTVSGVWVLDIDDPDAFAAKAPPLPITRKAITGKGFHLYWRHEGGEVRNAQRHPKRGWPFPDLPGAEVRGDGGYVILPPSRHPSGRLYEWADDGDPIPAPADLLRLMHRQSDNCHEIPTQDRPAHLPRLGGADSPYGLAALQRESEAILRAGNGEQESALNEAALKIGALAAGGELSISTAKARLIGAGLAMRSYDTRNAWTAAAIADKVERGLSDGATSPRSAPPREYRDAAFADGRDAASYDPATDDLHPLPTREPAEESGDIEPLDLASLATIEPRPKSFVIPALAPAGEVTLFTGPGSAGKSLWAQQVATALAAGVPTLGLDMGQASAIYLTCEDDPEQLHWRQAHICKALGLSMASLAGRLYLASLRGHLDNALGVMDIKGGFTLSKSYYRLAAFIKRTGAKLVALDNLAHLYTGNENDRGEVTQFNNALNRLAGESGAAIILLGHTNKAFNRGDTQGNGHSGSTAWVNAVRSQFVLEHDTKTDLRTVTVGKANYARKGKAMRFAWQDWAFVLERDLSPDRAAALDDVAKVNGENAAFLRCLEVCTKQRRNASHQPGSNYAPKMFAGMPEAEGIKSAGFAAALERLLHIGQIELDVELWRSSNRKWRRGIRATDAAQ